MTRPPSPAEVLASWRHRTEKQARFDARQRRQLTLVYSGWSAYSVRRGLTGPIGAYQDALSPPGLPEHLSERKSKRVWKKPVVISFFSRYFGEHLDRGAGPIPGPHNGYDRYPSEGVSADSKRDDSVDGRGDAKDPARGNG